MIGKHLKKVIGVNNKMDLIKCNQCGKLIAHIRFPWDDCGGQDFYCLECKYGVLPNPTLNYSNRDKRSDDE